MIDGIKIFVPREELGNFKRNELVSIGEGLSGLGSQLKSSPLVKLNFKENVRGLYIKGSIPYAINGNSFQSLSKEEVKTFFEDLSKRIGVNLFESRVLYFEAGATVEVPFKYNMFCNNHVGVDGMYLSCCKANEYKVFTDGKNRSVKVYDGGKNLRNISKVDKSVRERLTEKGLYYADRNYIKYEVKYIKPARVFNKATFTINDLLDDKVYAEVKNDVLSTYKGFKQTGYSIKVEKGNLDTIVVLACVLKKLELKYGNDVQQMINDVIKENSDKLSADGRCRRKKVIKNAFDKVSSGNKEVDIYDLLCAKLK